MYRRLLAVVIVTCGLLIGVWGAATARSVVAAPLSGTITVNSTTDNVTSDTVLTLREALLIARGGTDAGGLNRALSNSEKAQLSGCTFSGSSNNWLITGGCGAGITDTIMLNLPANATITLNAALPNIDDTAPTIVPDISNYPVIDASNLPADASGLVIMSNHNSVAGLTVRNSPIYNFYVTGDYNYLINITVVGAGGDGVYLSGSHDEVSSSHMGVNSDDTCNANAAYGIRVGQTASQATIHDSFINCNTAGGIYVDGAGAAGNHIIGPGNTLQLNHVDGLSLVSNGNVVMPNTIFFSYHHGVNISGNNNYLGGNTIRQNSSVGVEIRGTASYNYLGKLWVFGDVVSNTISHNNGNGVEISGTTVAYNYVLGNYIGLRPNGTVEGNGGDGVLIYGAHDSFIGGSVAQGNFIGYNSGNGVRLTGSSAAFNTLDANVIFSNTLSGVALVNSAQNNLLGSASSKQNQIMYNAQHGMVLDTGAFSNTIGAAGIAYNQQSGVLLQGGALSNRVGLSTNIGDDIIVFQNAAAGVALTGAGTAFNSLAGCTIFQQVPMVSC